jgi:hypothetical protein
MDPWQPISSAPFDQDLELSVIEANEAHALVFPCRRMVSGWLNVKMNSQVFVSPTHWRRWCHYRVEVSPVAYRPNTLR